MNEKLSPEVNAMLDQLATLPVEEGWALAAPLIRDATTSAGVARDTRFIGYCRKNFRSIEDIESAKRRAAELNKE